MAPAREHATHFGGANAYSARVRPLGVALLLLCVCLGATYPVLAAAPAAEVPQHVVHVSGVGVGMYPAFDADVERYAITTTDATDGTVTVTVATSDPSSQVRINGRVAPGGARKVAGLASGDEIAVFVSDGATTATYSLVYLPAGFPTLRRETSGFSADTPSPGMVLLTLGLWVQPSSFFEVAVDVNGVPVHVETTSSSLDFKRLPDGHYSVARGAATGGVEVVELDEQFREVGRSRTVGLANTDGHDSILLPDGSRYQLAYEPDLSTGKTDAVIQHVGADGGILFQWDSSDHVGETVVAPTDPDYAHVNSIQVMADGDLLVSFRHLSSVFKIARTAHDGFAEGDVVWKLGGRDSDFTFLDTEGVPDGGPCAQHTASELPNGDIMVFDNGAWNLTPLCIDPADPSGPPVARVPTRVAVWSLDEATGVATMEKDIRVANRYAIFAGSAQQLPTENIMIGWASATSAVATEVDAGGAVLWELVAEGSPKYFTYRAFKTDVPDLQAPRVSIAEPAEGAVFVQGTPVEATLDCTDRGGASLRTCTASAIDTSTPGARTFTAVATDGAGNQMSVRRGYTVIPATTSPPPPTVPLPGPVSPRPDAMIRKAGSRGFHGNDVYDAVAGQRVSATLRRPGDGVTAVVRVQNDGSTADRFTVTVQGKPGPFSVRLRLPDGRRTSPVLAPGESWTIRLRVVRTRKVESGDRVAPRIVARSLADPRRSDAVQLRVRGR